MKQTARRPSNHRRGVIQRERTALPKYILRKQTTIHIGLIKYHGCNIITNDVRAGYLGLFGSKINPVFIEGIGKTKSLVSWASESARTVWGNLLKFLDIWQWLHSWLVHGRTSLFSELFKSWKGKTGLYCYCITISCSSVAQKEVITGFLFLWCLEKVEMFEEADELSYLIVQRWSLHSYKDSAQSTNIMDIQHLFKQVTTDLFHTDLKTLSYCELRNVFCKFCRWH